MSRKERHFQGIAREIRNFPKIILSESFFVSNNFVSEGKKCENVSKSATKCEKGPKRFCQIVATL